MDLTFNELDHILLFMKSSIETNGVIDPAHMQLLKTFPTKGVISQIGAADARGDVVFSAVPLNTPVNVANRDYFQTHTKENTGQIFISPSRFTSAGATDIILSRRINDAKGNFAGVVFIGLDQNYFVDEFRLMDLGPDNSIVVLQTNGSFLARVPKVDSEDHMLYFKMHPVFSYLRQGITSGTYESPGAGDGKRVGGFRVLPDYPALVLVAIKQEHVLKNVLARHTYYRFAATAFSALLILASLALWWQMRKKHKVDLALTKSQMQQTKLIDAVPFGAYEYELRADGALIFTGYNKAADRILGVDHSCLLGSTIEESWPELIGTEIMNIYRSVARGGKYIDTLDVNCSQGPFKGVFEISPVQTGERRVGVFFRDVTDRRKMEKAMEYAGHHDPLTGLYNRGYFYEKIKDPFTCPVFMMIDIDGLKVINDTFGHKAGDNLLRVAANVLIAAAPKDAIVARLGGDEFAMLLPEADEEKVCAVADSIWAGVDAHNKSQSEQALPLQVSLGYALASEDLNVSAEELLMQADKRMYREKLCQAASRRSHVIRTLKQMLSARDYIAEGHALRVRDVALALAHKVGVEASKNADIELFAHFHDLGKVGIPDKILNKPGTLTDEERSQIQLHSEIGHRIAKSSDDLGP